MTKPPKLSGFVFSEELGLYVADNGETRSKWGLLGTSLGVSFEVDRKANDQCRELYHYSPWESGYDDFVYLAAGKLSLLSSGGEDISFTFPEALELAKLLGTRIGNNREFMDYNRDYGINYVLLLLGDVYDFTKDYTDIDVYVGIVTALTKWKRYEFLDENGEPIKPIKVRGAQAKALRKASYGNICRSNFGIVAYRDEIGFLASGKRVTEFDEHGIPTKLDNGKYDCTSHNGKYPHNHEQLSEFIGHRWYVKPESGVVAITKLCVDYWKPIGKGMYNHATTVCVGPTTYVNQPLNERLWKTNIFAVAGLENRVEECLRTLVQE